MVEIVGLKVITLTFLCRETKKKRSLLPVGLEPGSIGFVLQCSTSRAATSIVITVPPIDVSLVPWVTRFLDSPIEEALE